MSSGHPWRRHLPRKSTAYWYYCSECAQAYYPTVPSCPEEWVKVPERPR